MLLWLILPFYDFCCFWSVAINSIHKLHFLHLYLLFYYQFWVDIFCRSLCDNSNFWKMNRMLRHQVCTYVHKVILSSRVSLYFCLSQVGIIIKWLNIGSPLRELTCHMGSHSVTCNLAEVTFPPLPQPIKAGTRLKKTNRKSYLPSQMEAWHATPINASARNCL